MHKKEKLLLQKTVVPLLEQAFALYVKKYRFKPRTPVVVELFQNRSHYAVRTVGLPGLGALGVCFGQVITAISPTNGMFNWGQVLWHELNHVFTIQITRSRVPRWLTEGLAEMEPTLRRPEWKREREFLLYKAMQSKTGLRSMADLSLAFTQARNMQDMEVAYYQGYRATQFLVQHWGLPRVLTALRAYGKGQRTEQILPQITGVGVKELDRRFRDAQRQRLAHYQRSWLASPDDYRDLAARQKAAKLRPADHDAQAALAAALLAAGKPAEAKKQAATVLAKNPTQRLALYISAQLALHKRDHQGARKLLLRLVAAGGDSYRLRAQLGRMALRRKDLAAASKHLKAARRLDPEQSEPYMLLGRALEKAGKKAQAIAQYKGFVALDQHNFTALTHLLKLLVARKDFAGVRRYGRMAYYINPGSGMLHTILADAHIKPAPRPDLRKAIQHLELALACGPKKPADLHVRLARMYLQRKDQKRAKQHIEDALTADPEHAGARALKKKLP